MNRIRMTTCQTATKLVSPDGNRGKLGMHALAAFLCLLVSAGCFKGKGDRKAPPSLGLNLSPVEVFSDLPSHPCRERAFGPES